MAAVVVHTVGFGEGVALTGVKKHGEVNVLTGPSAGNVQFPVVPLTCAQYVLSAIVGGSIVSEYGETPVFVFEAESVTCSVPLNVPVTEVVPVIVAPETDNPVGSHPPGALNV